MIQVGGRHFRVSFLFSKREFCFQEDTFSMDYYHEYIDKVHQNMYVHEYVKLHKISEKKESILSYCVIKIKLAYGNRRAFLTYKEKTTFQVPFFELKHFTRLSFVMIISVHLNELE